MIWEGDKVVAYIKRDGETVGAQAPFRCSHCGNLSVGSTPYEPRNGVNGAKQNQEHWWAAHNGAITWTPASVAGKEFPDVPEHIASAADEAYRCLSNRAYRAAIMLGRAVVEATAKDHGIVQEQFAKKIDEMVTGGIVRGYTRDAAHEVRHLGNDVAHGDFVDATDAVDAEAVLVVMSSILEEVYQGPARVAAMKARRTREEELPESGIPAPTGMSTIDRQ